MRDAGTLWETWRTRRDAAAFEDLVRPELGRALAFARSLGCSAEDAEDALQETLVRLAGERSDAPTRIGVRAWFYRTVRDRARSRRRAWWRIRRRERAAARPEGILPGDASLGVREEVERALRGLTEEEREAVTLRYLQDLDYAEVAAVLGVSEGACRLRVHRALEGLRARLGPGAATMIAALPLPEPGGAAALVKGALAGALESGAAGAAGSAGGTIVMATASKVAAGAVGAALGLAAGLGVSLIAGNPGEGPPRSASPDPVESASVGDGGSPAIPQPAPSNAGPGARPSGGNVAAPPALRDLEPTPEEIGFLRGALLAERSRREVARFESTDGGLEVIRRVVDSGAAATDALSSFAAASARVRTGTGETRDVRAGDADPTVVDLSDIAGKSAVVEFGPGRFTFSSRSIPFHRVAKDRVVESLEIRGAGMDRTVLVLSGENLFMVQGRTPNLRLRDLTIEVGPGQRQLLDLRGEASLAMENVRISSGGTVIHAAGDFFLAAKGCEFLGTGSSLPFAFRGTTLAVFEECLFADHYSVVVGGAGAAAGSTVSFLGCVFENSRVTDSRIEHKGKPEYPVRVRGGRALFEPPATPDDQRRKDWGAGWLASLEGTEFGPGVPRCRVSDLLAVLDRCPTGPDEVVLCVRASEVAREGPRTFTLDVGDRATGAKKSRFFRWAGGALEEFRMEDRGGGFWVPPPKDTEGAMTLQQAVRRANVPEGSAATGLGYGSPAKVDDRAVPVTVAVHVPQGWPQWVLDGANGDVILGPK
jgi:RNA polymerase sigma factor (sigma-70 family)